MSALRTRLRALVLLGLLAASCAAPEVATRSPTSTVATSTPSAATTSSRTPGKESTGPTASGRPGLITRIDGPIVVRTESDSTPIRTVPSFQLSADGSRVTYWTESAGAAELHVLELGGGDRIVTKFPDRRPGGIAWSTDATGLLVSVAEPGDARYLIPRIVIAVDIGSGTTREIYRGTGPSGASVIPLVWRRSPEIFAAYETGPGGYSFGYTVIRPGQPSVRTDPDDPVVGMAASSDGAVVSGLWMREGGGVLKVWPVDDFAKKTELRVVAGEQLAQPRWWPGRSEIAFAAGRLADGAYRDARIERWDPAGGARTVLKRLPDMGNLGAYLIRADGSGLLTQGAYPPGAWEVTDLRTGAIAPIPQRPGESILGTVLLR